MREPCSISATYLRPDDGIAVIPWLYATILLILHLPLALIRVSRWDMGQIWSLVMATFAISLVSLAYGSTQGDPAQVYAWQPTTLIVDVGAVVQVLILLIEQPVEDRTAVGKDHDDRRIYRAILKLFTRFRGPPARTPQRQPTIDQARERQPLQSNGHLSPARATTEPEHELQPLQPNSHACADPDQTMNNPSPPSNAPVASISASPRFTGKQYTIISIAILLLLSLLTLQILGANFASRGLNNGQVLQDSYCSPAFQIGTQVFDLSCKKYTITPNFRGTGCIKIDGDQHTWLSGVLTALIVSIFVEIVDVIILILVKSTDRFRGVKMKRPWCSIFLGIVALCLQVYFGVSQASNWPLPHENGSPMLVVVNGTFEKLCSSQLLPGGLRGTIIAWSDAVFKGLDAYSPNNTVGAASGLS